MNRVAKILAFAGVLTLVCAAVPRGTRADDWQPIDPADLAMKDNPKQPGLDAMILYRQVSVDVSKANIDGDAEHEYYRIKVFTQDGTKRGHVEVEYDKTLANVVHVEGRTIKPDGSIVKFDGQVLETTVEKASGYKVFAKSFTLPDVQPGCIIEYRYSIQGQPNRVLDWGWIVSQDIYTREAHFVYTPYTGYGSNLHPIARRNHLPGNVTPQEQANGSFVMNVQDVPAIVEEPLMPPLRPIQGRVDFIYEDPEGPPITGPSDKYWNHYAEKWNGLMEKFIDKKKVLDAEVTRIVSPSDPAEVKLRKIYARVQKIRNLSTEDYKSEKERKDENIKENNNVEDVLNHGYAYIKQLNYLFVGLARAAGFEATEVYVAPRNSELFQPAMNDLSQVRNELVWVRADSKEYYLDPEADFYPFGLLPWYETSTTGFRVDKHGATMVSTSNPDSSDAILARTVDLSIQPTGEITGTLRADFGGQRGALIRLDERKEDEAGRTKFFENLVKGWLPAGATFEVSKISDWDDNSKPIRLEGKITVPSLVTTAAQRMLMPIDLFQMPQLTEFASEKRVNAVYIHYPYEEVDNIKLHLPAGYKVEGVPAAKNVDLKAVSCEIAATAQGDTVEIKRHFAERNVLFSQDQYQVLRKFFQIVKTNDSAQMVFRNAESAHN